MVLPPEKALAIATLSKIEINGMMRTPVPTLAIMSLKPTSVPLVPFVEKGGGLNAGNPGRMSPKILEKSKSSPPLKNGMLLQCPILFEKLFHYIWLADFQTFGLLHYL